jgi:hypothetical protein
MFRVAACILTPTSIHTSLHLLSRLNKSLLSNTKIDEDGYLLDPTHDDGSDTLVAASVTSKKRQRANDDEDDNEDVTAPPNLKKSKVMQKDGQTAKSQSVSIPVDENVPSRDKYRVYIDDDGMIFDGKP